MTALQSDYEQDFHHWIERHIDLLKNKQLDELDIEHLIEELEGMANRDVNELISHLVILIAHLLKWRFQFAHFSNTWQQAGDYAAKSWQYPMIEHRFYIQDQLENIPSLKQHLEDAVRKVYPKAVNLAVKETGLPLKTFPTHCPYSIEQLVDEDFYPETVS